MKKKLSGPAVFMYSTILLTVLTSLLCFLLYYSGIHKNNVILWTGIVSFMILYHFGLRILMGKWTEHLEINYSHPWYRTRKFEKSLYKLLKVRKWKDKVLTFEPDKYDFKNRTLEQLATTMAKSELDHWINQIISLLSMLYAFLWGCAPAFVITAVLAMLFDAQFIVVQRYNRPIVLRLMKAKERINHQLTDARI
ncbi:MAG: hypothetical protein E7588_02320 [Ruminococcaceae bacterium]|nr:hypothetical protein [Oscillospiraceae bacterium]